MVHDHTHSLASIQQSGLADSECSWRLPAVPELCERSGFNTCCARKAHKWQTCRTHSTGLLNLLVVRTDSKLSKHIEFMWKYVVLLTVCNSWIVQSKSRLNRFKRLERRGFSTANKYGCHVLDIRPKPTYLPPIQSFLLAQNLLQNRWYQWITCNQVEWQVHLSSVVKGLILNTIATYSHCVPNTVFVCQFRTGRRQLSQGRSQLF